MGRGFFWVNLQCKLVLVVKLYCLTLVLFCVRKKIQDLVFCCLSMLRFLKFLDCIIVLPQTLEMLEKKEGVLLKKANGELERAKEFSRVKNKRCKTKSLAFDYYEPNFFWFRRA